MSWTVMALVNAGYDELNKAELKQITSILKDKSLGSYYDININSTAFDCEIWGDNHGLNYAPLDAISKILKERGKYFEITANAYVESADGGYYADSVGE